MNRKSMNNENLITDAVARINAKMMIVFPNFPQESNQLKNDFMISSSLN
jgi:hypothetical protein